MSNNSRKPHPAPSPWRSKDDAARKKHERAAAKLRREIEQRGRQL